MRELGASGRAVGAAKAMGKDRIIILTRKARCSGNQRICASNIFWVKVKG